MPANGWRPRPNQQALWDYFNDPVSKRFDGTSKRAMMIAHRRWGKDEIALNMVGKASVVRPATYWHLLPEYEQGRKAIWNAINPHTGRRRIDEAFPAEWRDKVDDRGMFIRFKWGATWQVVGSDNYQSLVGTPPAGIILSEWAKAQPGAWAYLSPILVENKGWALAITTPEGRNHAHKMLREWRRVPGYFTQVQTIEDTIRHMTAAGLEPPFTLDDVEVARREYHGLYGQEAGDALIEQEYFCSFESAILGAYFGKAMSQAEADGRIGTVKPIPGYPINTAWDIGNYDPMAVWVFQVGPGWFHMLDYIEGSNVGGFEYFTKWLDERGYKGGIDFVPHDAKQHEVGASGGRTRIATLFALGRNPVLVERQKILDRINAARRILGQCWFDAEKCAIGLEALRSYKQQWDEKNSTFLKTPKHDWASHGASAFTYMAVAVEFTAPVPEKKPQIVVPPPITMAQLLKAKPGRSKWI